MGEEVSHITDFEKEITNQILDREAEKQITAESIDAIATDSDKEPGHSVDYSREFFGVFGHHIIDG